MKRFRQAIINWLFQDDIPSPAQQPNPPLPCQPMILVEQSFPILDLDRMEMTTFYLKGIAIHPRDVEPTQRHYINKEM